MKKFVAMLLAAVMLLSFAAVSAEDAHQLIYGATTEISGDFAPDAWWTNNATDKMIRDFTTDYGTVVTDQGGALVINDTVCEDIESEMNEDGTKTYTVKIKDGLVFNNGEAITIKDFVWPTAFSCSAVSSEVGAKLTGYMTIVGGQEFYDGTASTISGLRILDDNTIQVSVVADKVPYFFDLSYAGFAPFSMKYWLGEDVDIADDGEGVYFTGLTKDAIESQLNYARFNAGEDRVTAGPYNLVEFDQSSKQATLVKNENYQGNFEGQIPTIEKIIITKAEDATWADALKTGAFNFYDTMMDVGLLLMEEGDSFTIWEEEKECAVLLFQGAAEIAWNDKRVEAQRPDCFYHEAYCLLAPRRTEIRLTARCHSEIYIQKTLNERDYEAVLYTPETVQTQHAGAKGELDRKSVV